MKLNHVEIKVDVDCDIGFVKRLVSRLRERGWRLEIDQVEYAEDPDTGERKPIGYVAKLVKDAARVVIVYAKPRATISVDGEPGELCEALEVTGIAGIPVLGHMFTAAAGCRQ